MVKLVPQIQLGQLPTKFASKKEKSETKFLGKAIQLLSMDISLYVIGFHFLSTDSITPAARILPLQQVAIPFVWLLIQVHELAFK